MAGHQDGVGALFGSAWKTSHMNWKPTPGDQVLLKVKVTERVQGVTSKCTEHS